ncbi:MAG: M48 family metalloprotease [Desulfarculus sp.]|nr:M48 family metalloprotease [Desulfarculus sp.]
MLKSGLTWLLVLLMALGCWPGPAQALITLEEERKIGREAYDEIMREVPLITDPDILGYVRGLGNRLVAELNDNPFDYTFNVADSGDLNAFALPGGYIFFFRGMITALDSEAELAGILGHEISHVSHRHLAHRMENTAPLNAAMLAGMLAGVALGALGKSPQMGQALTFGSLAGGIQAHLAFSRDDEEQADYAGFRLMTGLGYPGQEMAVSFNRIWRVERIMGAEVPNYLRSHPTSPQRMERMDDMARRGPAKQRPYDNTTFQVVKTRLIALYDNEDTAETTFQRQRRENPQDPMPMYGMALVEGRRSRYEQALAYLRSVEAQWPGKPYILRAQATAHLRLGEPAQAQTLLRQVLLAQPEDKSALSSLGQAYLQQDHLPEARGVYERLVKLDPKDHEAMYNLGLTLGKMGRTSQASLYLGLAFQMRGSERSARFHLAKAAQAADLSVEEHKRAEEALAKLDDREAKKHKQQLEQDRRRRDEERRRDDERRRDEERRRPDPRNPDSTSRPWFIGR